jgi:hypothetical protein
MSMKTSDIFEWRDALMDDVRFAHRWPDDVRFAEGVAYWLQRLGGMLGEW